MLVLQSPVRFDTEHYGPGWHTHQLSDEWYISQAVAGCYMIRWRFIRAMHALHANTGTSTFCLSNRCCAIYGVCDGHALLHAEMTRHLRRCGYSIENLQLFQPLNRLLSSHCAYSGTGEIAIFCPKGPAVACFSAPVHWHPPRQIFALGLLSTFARLPARSPVCSTSRPRQHLCPAAACPTLLGVCKVYIHPQRHRNKLGRIPLSAR